MEFDKSLLDPENEHMERVRLTTEKQGRDQRLDPGLFCCICARVFYEVVRPSHARLTAVRQRKTACKTCETRCLTVLQAGDFW